jgi:hypothetical protein
MDNLKYFIFLLRTNKKLLVLTILGAVLIVSVMVFSFFLFMQNRDEKNRENNTGSSADSSAQERRVNGKMMIKVKDNKLNHKENETITLILYIHSQGELITGYDASIKFEPELVRFENQKNLFEDFKHFRKVGGEWLLLSAARGLDTQPFILNEKAVMEFSFKALKAGNPSFHLSLVPNGTNDSNLININSQDILSEVNSVSVVVTK